MVEKSYTLEALTNQWNLIGVGFLVLLSFVMWTPIPALAALGLEMIFLATVPGTSFFQKMVERKYKAIAEEERQKKIDKRLSTMPHEYIRRFQLVSRLADDTRTRLEDNPDNLVSGAENRLDSFQERYLTLCENLLSYEELLNAVNDHAIRQDIDAVESEIECSEGRLRRSLIERHEILKKRLARYYNVRDNFAIVTNQLATIEDTLKLIHESAMTVRGPLGLSSQLDDLLSEMQIAEDAVLEAEAIVAPSHERLDSFDAELAEALEEVEII